jgi:chromosome segregation ATPase
METMNNPNEQYNRLHDHMTAIARERDYANQQLDAIKRLLDETTKELQQAQDELILAIEALVRARGDKP